MYFDPAIKMSHHSSEGDESNEGIGRDQAEGELEGLLQVKCKEECSVCVHALNKLLGQLLMAVSVDLTSASTVHKKMHGY